MQTYYIKIRRVGGGYIIDRFPYMEGEKCCVTNIESIAKTPTEAMELLNEWFELMERS